MMCCLCSTQKESEDAPGPMEFKDASEMLKKDAKRLNKMGLLTGERSSSSFMLRNDISHNDLK